MKTLIVSVMLLMAPWPAVAQSVAVSAGPGWAGGAAWASVGDARFDVTSASAGLAWQAAVGPPWNVRVWGRPPTRMYLAGPMDAVDKGAGLGLTWEQDAKLAFDAEMRRFDAALDWAYGRIDAPILPTVGLVAAQLDARLIVEKDGEISEASRSFTRIAPVVGLRYVTPLWRGAVFDAEARYGESAGFRTTVLTGAVRIGAPWGLDLCVEHERTRLWDADVEMETRTRGVFLNLFMEF